MSTPHQRSRRVAGGRPVGSPVTAAAHVVAALIAGGVRDIVVCPGSRSAPLAYALHKAETDGLVRLHVRHDERTAGFFALGCGKADPAHPAAVVTTSGSAAANLMPAAIEARHAGVGLVLITADRPPRLRGTWANQTSDLQAGLFEQVALHCVDSELARLSPDGIASIASESLRAAARGPVHLNLCFDEPLQPAAGEPVLLPDVALQPVGGWPHDAGGREVVQLRLGPRTVVVAADGAGPAARMVAEEVGWPLLAEPSSGSRGGPNLIDGYRNLLGRNGFGAEIQRVVVFGRPTLSRPVTRLLDDPQVQLVHVVRHRDEPGPGRPALRVLGEVTARRDEGNEAWLDLWRTAGAAYAKQLHDTLAGWPRLTGPAIGAALVAATGTGDALVIGASNPIRDVDLAGGGTADGALVLSNRGLAGIDGTLSTALGVCIATGRPTRLFVGDLTFLHDLAALALPAAERARLRVQIVVLNDDGGGIFATLEHGDHPTQFERVFGTPTGADLALLSTGFGADHRLVTDRGQLARALAEVRPGLEVVEVRADRSDLRPLHERLSAL